MNKTLKIFTWKLGFISYFLNQKFSKCIFIPPYHPSTSATKTSDQWVPFLLEIQKCSITNAMPQGSEITFSESSLSSMCSNSIRQTLTDFGIPQICGLFAVLIALKIEDILVPKSGIAASIILQSHVYEKTCRCTAGQTILFGLVIAQSIPYWHF